jgi:hypothetical protein
MVVIFLGVKVGLLLPPQVSVPPPIIKAFLFKIFEPLASLSLDQEKSSSSSFILPITNCGKS